MRCFLFLLLSVLPSMLWAETRHQPTNGIIKLSELELTPQDDAYWDYFWGKPTVTPVDPATYQILNFNWSKDQHYVYDKYERMNVFDTANWTMRPVDPHSFRVLNAVFATDGKHIFSAGKVVKQVARPDSFKVLDEGCWIDGLSKKVKCGGYASDADTVYFNGDEGIKIIHDAAPASFVSLGLLYGKDAKHVYYYGEPVEHADPDSFEIIGPAAFARDAQHVFYAGHIVNGADPESFTALGGPYGQDQQYVYDTQRRLPDIKPGEFKFPSWMKLR